MDISYIADANSPHTRRWIEPIQQRGNRVRVFSYAPVTTSAAGIESIDLTQYNNTSIVRFLLWAKEIRRRLRMDRSDIIHAHQIQAAGWLGYLSGAHPFVVSAWGSDILVGPVRSRFSRFLTSRVIQKCDALTVPSRHMFDTALQLGTPREKLWLIPWGIDQEPFRPRAEDREAIREQLGFRRDDIIVLSPRGLKPIYNHDIVVKSVASVLGRNSRLKLTFIRPNVEGKYLHELCDMIAQLGIEHAVRWLPYQRTMADLGRVYRMSDIVVSVPSSEGYGFTVFESLASGTPTIISDLPVFESVLEDGLEVVKVASRDSEATATALQSLISDMKLRASLRQSGLDYASYSTVEQRVDLASQLYESLLYGR